MLILAYLGNIRCKSSENDHITPLVSKCFWKETCDGHFQVVVLVVFAQTLVVVLPSHSGLGSPTCQANAKAGAEEPDRWRHCAIALGGNVEYLFHQNFLLNFNQRNSEKNKKPIQTQC